MDDKKTVEAYINKHPKWEDQLTTLRDLILETELDETIKWGLPVYTLDNKNIVGLAAFKNHMGIWFFQGVFLDDPDNKLLNAQEGKTKAMRQLRFLKQDEIDKDEVRGFIQQAIDNQKAGKELKAEKNKKLEIPPELDKILSEDPELKTQFEDLTPYKQREYAEHIAEAKRDSTKKRRLEKIIPMIQKGVGLNDKYR
ncbi:MAG: hypothetical protein FH748_15490 [Balneolaceae bacterium]|nr:hypothetical protein [Balneolaceae bacterium]